MQKKLIAAAVAGLIAVPALAQSNVTISGNWFMGYESNKTTGTAGNGTVNRIQDQSSAIIFSGVEDLGSGLKAHFQLDTRFGPDQGGANGWSTGNSGVGLMGNWGKFTLGRWDLHYSELAGGLGAPRARSLATLVGHGLMSEVNGVGIAARTRSQNVFKYDTPMWNGFNGTLAYSTNPMGAEGGQAANGSSGNAWTGALRYANGPWNAGLSYWRYNQEGGNGTAAAATAVTSGATTLASINANTGTTGSQRSTRLWGSYTFAMGLRVGLGWDSSKADTDATAGSNWVKRNAWMIPVSYSFGPHQVYFQYARAGNTSGAAVDNATSARIYMLGYDYALSKRTLVGAYYTKLNNSTNGTYDLFATAVPTAAGDDSRQFYVGLAHHF